MGKKYSYITVTNLLLQTLKSGTSMETPLTCTCPEREVSYVVGFLVFCVFTKLTSYLLSLSIHIVSTLKGLLLFFFITNFENFLAWLNFWMWWATKTLSFIPPTVFTQRFQREILFLRFEVTNLLLCIVFFKKIRHI